MSLEFIQFSALMTCSTTTELSDWCSCMCCICPLHIFLMVQPSDKHVNTVMYMLDKQAVPSRYLMNTCDTYGYTNALSWWWCGTALMWSIKWISRKSHHWWEHWDMAVQAEMNDSCMHKCVSSMQTHHSSQQPNNLWWSRQNHFWNIRQQLQQLITWEDLTEHYR